MIGLNHLARDMLCEAVHGQSDALVFRRRQRSQDSSRHDLVATTGGIAHFVGQRMHRWRTLIGLLSILASASAMARPSRVPRLSTIARGGKGPPTIVMLHGYCSSERDWLPFTKSIQLPPGTRFLFPRGPELARRTDGGPTGRAWWHLDLASNMRDGVLGADLSAEKPAGIDRAALAVRALLARQGNRPEQPFLLGGFSQGAMVAAQVAFGSDEPLRALVLLSGTLVDEASWKPSYARRKGLHVFIAHGRTDPTLSFEVAERMHSEMAAAGMQVTWFPFDGGHETPAEVVVALNDFLARL
jgi:phospholipase/carboxylesterase